METVILKVSSKSNPNKVGSSIVWMTKEEKKVELQAIGNGAVGQSIKAITVANQFAAKEGFTFSAVPVWVDLVIDEKERSGMKIILRKEDLPTETE